MAGTKEGARKGVRTKIKKYGKKHFAEIGAEGGKNSKGRTLSRETRQKISDTKKQRWNYNHTRLLEEGKDEDNQTSAE